MLSATEPVLGTMCHSPLDSTPFHFSDLCDTLGLDEHLAKTHIMHCLTELFEVTGESIRFTCISLSEGLYCSREHSPVIGPTLVCTLLAQQYKANSPPPLLQPEGIESVVRALVISSLLSITPWDIFHLSLAQIPFHRYRIPPVLPCLAGPIVHAYPTEL